MPPCILFVLQEYENYDAVNYNKWKICKPACDCGVKLNVPLYKFLKEALTRKVRKRLV